MKEIGDLNRFLVGTVNTEQESVNSQKWPQKDSVKSYPKVRVDDL